MARYIEQGKSIFIPFHKGVSITDSQLHLRMYKTEEMFRRYGYACGEVDVLCEYAPVVRCKDCKHGIWDDEETMWKCVYDAEFDEQYGEYFGFAEYNDGEHFCSYGERRGDGDDTSNLR